MRNLVNKLQSRIFFLLSFVYLAAGMLFGLIVYYLWDKDYLTRYFVIVFFFFLTGIINNYIVDRTIRKKVDKLLSVYMALRMGKFLLTIIFLSVFVVFILEDSHKLPFAILLMIHYILYTSLELFTFNLYYKHAIKDAKKE